MVTSLLPVDRRFRIRSIQKNLERSSWSKNSRSTDRSYIYRTILRSAVRATGPSWYRKFFTVRRDDILRISRRDDAATQRFVWLSGPPVFTLLTFTDLCLGKGSNSAQTTHNFKPMTPLPLLCLYIWLYSHRSVAMQLYTVNEKGKIWTE